MVVKVNPVLKSTVNVFWKSGKTRYLEMCVGIYLENVGKTGASVCGFVLGYGVSE